MRLSAELASSFNALHSLFMLRIRLLRSRQVGSPPFSLLSCRFPSLLASLLPLLDTSHPFRMIGASLFCAREVPSPESALLLCRLPSFEVVTECIERFLTKCLQSCSLLLPGFPS